MSMERLIVQNFGPIKDVDIEIPRLLVFIGDQATGKSTLGRLIYIFKHASSLITRFPALNKNVAIDVDEIKRDISGNMKSYFDMCFFYNDTKIEYQYSDDYFIIVSFNFKDNINVILSEKIITGLEQLKKLTAKYFESRRSAQHNELKPSAEELEVWRQMHRVSSVLAHNVRGRAIFEYMSASRAELNIPIVGTYSPDSTITRRAMSAFSELIDGIVNLTEAKKQFVDAMSDMYIAPVGFFDKDPEQLKRYEERARRISALIKKKSEFYGVLVRLAYKLLGGYFQEQEDIGYGIALSTYDNSRFIPYKFLSSGQKSEIPLIACVSLIGSILSELPLELPFNSLVLEEPEAHVYPKNQFHLIKLIATAMAINDSSKFVITTHSPYILASIHALSSYGLADGDVEALDKYDDLVPIKSDKENLGIYLLKDGHAKSLRDEESGLFDTSEIDSISDEINEVFDESVIAREMKKGAE